MAGKDESPKPQNTVPAKPTMPENRVVKGNDPRPEAFKLIDTLKPKQ